MHNTKLGCRARLEMNDTSDGVSEYSEPSVSMKITMGCGKCTKAVKARSHSQASTHPPGAEEQKPRRVKQGSAIVVENTYVGRVWNESNEGNRRKRSGAWASNVTTPVTSACCEENILKR